MDSRVHVPEAWNRITESVIGCAFAVYKELGPGLNEILYERAMEIEFRAREIVADSQKRCTVSYKGERIGDQVMDLVVCDLVVVELKSAESVNDHHLAQLHGYLRATDLPLGLLINFNAMPLREGIYRRINPRSHLFYSSNSLPSVSSASSAPLRTSPSSRPH